MISNGLSNITSPITISVCMLSVADMIGWRCYQDLLMVSSWLWYRSSYYWQRYLEYFIHLISTQIGFWLVTIINYNILLQQACYSDIEAWFKYPNLKG